MPSDGVASRPPPNFLKYPHPDVERVLGHVKALGVKEETTRCIHNLLHYRAVHTRARFPRASSSAVLVPLFVSRSGDLLVLLSRRSDTLKTFAGDTALPGGRIDAEDVTIEDTARREAFEEVGLPRDKERVPLLCVMEPHLAKGEIMVTPVVVLILEPEGLEPHLNPSEVTSIFARPLVSFLASTFHLPSLRSTDSNVPYHSFIDIPWSDGGTFRLHKFLTGRESEGVKPVFGLTASILIKIATIAYERPPDFEVQPRDAPTPAQQIAYALLTPANPIRVACEREGVDPNEAAARTLRPPLAASNARMMEWRKIGMEWRKLMEADGERVEGVDESRTSTAADEHSERAEEGGEEYRERREAIADLERLGAYLDRTRDMVNKRMKEVKGDKKKLAKARKAYPKILEQAKKQLDEARDENGEFSPEALLAILPKERREPFKDDSAGREGVNRRDVEKENWRHLRRKHNAKL